MKILMVTMLALMVLVPITTRAVVVDDFTAGDVAIYLSNPGITAGSSLPTAVPVGFDRVVNYSIAGPPPVEGRLYLNHGPFYGVVLENAVDGMSYVASLDYTSVTPVDLKMTTVSLLNVRSDVNSQRVRADAATSSGPLSSGWVTFVNQSGDLLLPLAGIGDIHSVTELKLVFEGTPGSDLRFGGISTVPEPAEYTVVAALGLTIFVMRRRRMSS